MTPARRRDAAGWIAAALLVLVGLAAYANSLGNPFVFDDIDAILENQTIRSFATAVRGGPVQSAMAGRPVANLSLWVNYSLGASDPAGYHLWNLGIHLLSGLVLFGIVRRTLRQREAAGTPRDTAQPLVPAKASQRQRRTPSQTRSSAASSPPPFSSPTTWLSFACALLWVVHPLHTEVVDYVTQRTESMMGLAYLVTLYAWIRGWTLVAVAACALGMMTKESMVTAPMMVLLYDDVFTAGSLSAAIRGRRGGYAGLAATWLVLAAMIASGPRWRSAGFSSGVSAWTYLLNQPELIVTYLWRAIWPAGFVLDYGLPRQVTLHEALPAGLVVILLLSLTLVAWLRKREIAYLGLWFFITLAPTSSVVPIATEVGAERRMYLPLAAVVVLIVLGLHTAVKRLASRQRWAPDRALAATCGVAGAAACVLIAATVHRNREYATGAEVWRTVVERRPHGRAHYNLGLLLKAEGHRDEAIAEYRLALPEAPEAHYALGFEFDAAGDRRGAIEHFREFVRLKPLDINAVRAYNLLGRALDAQGETDEAAAAFEQVRRMQPGNADALGGLADIALKRQRFEEAVTRYQEYIRLAPQNAAARFNLGLALLQSNATEAAAAAFAEAVRLNPRDVAFRVNLAEALLALGRADEAATHYNVAVQLQPDDQELYARMSQVIAAAKQQK